MVYQIALCCVDNYESFNTISFFFLFVCWCAFWNMLGVAVRWNLCFECKDLSFQCASHIFQVSLLVTDKSGSSLQTTTAAICYRWKESQITFLFKSRLIVLSLWLSDCYCIQEFMILELRIKYLWVWMRIFLQSWCACLMPAARTDYG